MASITITLPPGNVCSGGEHLTFVVSGAASVTRVTTLTEVTQDLTPEDAEAFIRVLVRLGKIGRTNAQLRTLFQNGVTVTV